MNVRREASGPQLAKIVCGVTVFHPECQILDVLINDLSFSGCPIALWIDGPVGEVISHAYFQRLSEDKRIHLLGDGRNLGVGHGLNRLADYAKNAGATHICYFDQDSTPSPQMLAAMTLIQQDLQQSGLLWAALGPKPIPARSSKSRKSPYFRRRGSDVLPSIYPVDFIITSGMIVDIASMEKIGTFREDYFIDAIDTEWCFRAWSLGFKVLLAENIEMEHRVGTDVLRLGCISFPRQSEDRMVTYIRNQMHGMRLRHLPLSWKFRNLIYLPLQAAIWLTREGFSWKTFCRFAAAFRRGLTEKFPDDYPNDLK